MNYFLNNAITFGKSELLVYFKASLLFVVCKKSDSEICRRFPEYFRRNARNIY